MNPATPPRAPRPVVPDAPKKAPRSRSPPPVMDGVALKLRFEKRQL